MESILGGFRMNLGHLLFGFEGRISRLPYWLGGIALAVVMSIAIATGLELAAIPVSPWTRVLPTLVILWPLAATSVKRAHDRNRSPWILAPAFAAEFILIALDFAFVEQAPVKVTDANYTGLSFFLALTILNYAYQLYLLVELGFLRGTIGPNRYGPDPLVEPIPTPVQG